MKLHNSRKLVLRSFPKPSRQELVVLSNRFLLISEKCKSEYVAIGDWGGRASWKNIVFCNMKHIPDGTSSP